MAASSPMDSAGLGWAELDSVVFSADDELVALNGLRTGHFLDTPESLPIHDIGNNENIFDRLDFQPNGRDAYHLDLFVARNWFRVPNSYDQLTQDQKQRVLTWNIAPGYQHTFGSSTLLTINPFARRDQVNYYGSRNPFNDTPITESQIRFLTNWGVRADLAKVYKNHALKFGMQIQQTPLAENFQLGITSAAYNPVCVGAGGGAVLLPGITDPGQCSLISPAYVANPNLLPGLVPYDLTRGGSEFAFRDASNVNQYAFYAADTIRFGELTADLGFRLDRYDGLVSKTGPQPRIGLSYHLPKSNTVLRAAYSRTFETPFNENLLLSSATGSGGLAQNVFGAKGSIPIAPGFRNQFNAGLQQSIGKYLIFDADYFWKYTHNAYDFDVLFNTPITFPIAWHNSKLDGLTGRLSTINIHGFQAYTGFLVVPYYDPALVFFPPRPGFVVGGAIRFGFGVSIDGFFSPWGWSAGGIRFDWGGHAVFLNNARWGRTWVNRGAYIHPYPAIRRPGPGAVRPPEAHALHPRSEPERNAPRQGKPAPREQHRGERR